MDHQPETVSLRDATPADLPFLRALAARLVDFGELTTRDPAAVVTSSERTLEEAVTQVAQGSATVAVLVAVEPNGTRLGCVQMQRGEEHFSGQPEVYVGVLAVTAEAEGRGVARALTAGVEAWARQQGCARIALEVFAANGRARAFYERSGFVEDSLRVVKRL
jgi:ribosomal protein S18 acetylase RimI-like enzyme